MACYSLSHKDRYLFLDLHQSWRLKKKYVVDIMRISSSSLVEQMFLRMGFFMYSKSIAILGTVAFAAHQLCMNVMRISFSFGDGLQIANTSLVGQSLGAKRPDMAKIHSKVTQRLGIIVAIILAFTVILFRKELLGLFTSDISVIEMGKNTFDDFSCDHFIPNSSSYYCWGIKRSW